MIAELPAPVRLFFESDAARDDEGLRAVLAPEIHVHDEAQDYHGPDEVIAWRKAAAAKYTYTSTPLAHEHAGDQVRVRARLEGNFPGSPADVTYAFVLRDGLIAGLGIG